MIIKTMTIQMKSGRWYGALGWYCQLIVIVKPPFSLVVGKIQGEFNYDLERRVQTYGILLPAVTHLAEAVIPHVRNGKCAVMERVMADHTYKHHSSQNQSTLMQSCGINMNIDTFLCVQDLVFSVSVSVDEPQSAMERIPGRKGIWSQNTSPRLSLFDMSRNKQSYVPVVLKLGVVRRGMMSRLDLSIDIRADHMTDKQEFIRLSLRFKQVSKIDKYF